MFKKPFSLVLLLFCLTNCQTALEKYGQQYQQTGTLESLTQATDLIPNGADTTYLRKILGEPIDMGFDYRYLTELTGENGCVIGAVFHLDQNKKVDDKWVGEICE